MKVRDIPSITNSVFFCCTDEQCSRLCVPVGLALSCERFDHIPAVYIVNVLCFDFSFVNIIGNQWCSSQVMSWCGHSCFVRFAYLNHL
jgi:hypothetical protein